MITEKWLEWLKDNNEIETIYQEIGKPVSDQDNDWLKKVSKSNSYKEFIKEKIAPGEIASSEIGNMYTASIFMSLLSSLSVKAENTSNLKGKKIGFISYGSGSKSKIFEGTVESNWLTKIKSINLFENLNSRKKISVEIYEKLHRRKISSNINNNEGVIKLRNIESGEFTEGLRSYINY